MFVPASCTGQLQPNDLCVNSVFKTTMRQKFTKWYAHHVKNMLDDGCSAAEVKVDLQASVVKPVHAAWLIEVYEEISRREDVVRTGFLQAGLARK